MSAANTEDFGIVYARYGLCACTSEACVAFCIVYYLLVLVTCFALFALCIPSPTASSASGCSVAAMDAVTLTTMLHACPVTSHRFCGCYDSKNLPRDIKSRQLPVALALNYRIPKVGPHWAALWVVNPTTAFFFCPLGRPAPPELRRWLDTHFRHVGCNQRAVQDDRSSSCGAYVIYAIWHFCRGYTLRDLIAKLREMGDRRESTVHKFVQTVGGAGQFQANGRVRF